MSKLQAANNYPDITDGHEDPYTFPGQPSDIVSTIEENKHTDQTNRLLEAFKAQQIADNIDAFNMGLQVFHEQDTKALLSEFSDEEIAEEYHSRYPF